jgi:hypothetical protein
VSGPFTERVNTTAQAGQPIFAVLNGQKIAAAYVRPMLARPHRCVIAWKYSETRTRFATISTRKVTLA